MKKIYGSLGKIGLLFCLSLGAVFLSACTRHDAVTENVSDSQNIREEGDKVFALYGFSREDPRFTDRSDEEILDLLKSWKINAVFGAHKNAELAGVLRRGGIKIYAEFGVFVGEQLWERFPASRPVTSEGRLLEKIDWYAGVNPSCEEVREHRLLALRELLETCSLDGVWLDFIRWPGRWENPDPRLIAASFDQGTLEKFSTDTGIILDIESGAEESARIIMEEHFDQWADWRTRQITSWVADARAVVNQVSPGTELCLFSVPWTTDFSDAVINYLGQDFEALSDYIDVFSPMVYHRMCGRSVPWIGEVSEWIREVTGKDVLPIIQTLDDPDILSPEEFGEAVHTALAAPGSGGVILFNLKGLSTEKIEVALKNM